MKNLIGLRDIKYEIDNLGEVPHILFTGPRGTGKTTLAQYIAEKKRKRLLFATGNTLKLNELISIFVTMEKGDVLLIDEIHRLNPKVEELLYQPMERFELPVKDVSGRIQIFDLPQFTLIGTTTKPSAISKPLMSRFKITFQIPHYNLRELARIIIDSYQGMSKRNAIKVACNVVTPREAINLAYRVTQLGNDIPKNLEFIGYRLGLSRAERQYLKIVHNVGKISLTSLVSALQLDEDEVRYIEDKLIQRKLIQISSKGRSLTVSGLLKLKELSLNINAL